MPIKINPTSTGIRPYRITVPEIQIPRLDLGLSLGTGSRTFAIGSATSRSDLLSTAQQKTQQTQNPAPSEDTEVFHDPVLLSEADFERIKSLDEGEEVFENCADIVESKYATKMPVDAFSMLTEEVGKKPHPFTDQKSEPEPAFALPSAKKVSFAEPVASSSFSPLETSITNKLHIVLAGLSRVDEPIRKAFFREASPFHTSTLEKFFKAIPPDMPSAPVDCLKFEFDELDLSDLIALSKKMEPLVDRYLGLFNHDNIKLNHTRKYNFPPSTISTEAATSLRFCVALASGIRRKRCEKSIALTALMNSAKELTFNIVSKNRDTSGSCVSAESPPADLHLEGDLHTDMLSTTAIPDLRQAKMRLATLSKASIEKV